jgi:hypothetical protein
MSSTILEFDDRWRGASRLLPLAATAEQPISALELATLLIAGATASLAVNLLRLRLGIPGSSIVQASIPLALGLALVPRRGAGSVMAAGAIGTNAMLALAGLRLDGVGAQTSLVLTGPLLELARSGGFRGWRLYVAFICACMVSNAAAFLVRSLGRLYGIRGGGGGGNGMFAGSLPHALPTYALCGAVAGLIGAGAWFHLREPDRP